MVGASQSVAGGWLYQNSSDAMDDSAQSMAIAVIPDKPLGSGYLGVFCIEGGITIIVEKAFTFHLDSTIDVQYRVDDKKARTRSFFWNTGDSAALLIGNEAVTFAREVFSAKERIVVALEGEVLDVYSADNLHDSVSRVMKDCNL